MQINNDRQPGIGRLAFDILVVLIGVLIIVALLAPIAGTFAP